MFDPWAQIVFIKLLQNDTVGFSENPMNQGPAPITDVN